MIYPVAVFSIAVTSGISSAVVTLHHVYVNTCGTQDLLQTKKYTYSCY